MGKGNVNPADAYRKAQRKKELKKNKTERAKARDFALVKKDTTEFEEEIEKLEASGENKARLSELKAELEKIKKKKEEYVNEHPEQRNLVYRKRRRQQDDEAKPENTLPQKRNLFNKKGLPRHPERSIYYDPVMNPYGVPPPGMPYMERPLRPEEIDSEAESGDDDIPLPTGLPPGTESIQSDDEIFMPDGPPPSKMNETSSDTPSVPSENPPPSLLPPPPPPLPGTSAVSHLPPPPPPPGFPPNMLFPPPFPPNVPFPHPPPGIPMQTGVLYPPGPLTPLPPPPIGFFPRQQSTSSLQDPLSSVPHTTYQVHRAGQATSQVSLPLHPSLPPKPVAAVHRANATISAEPQLRDFKKEATAFLPTSLNRKKAGGKVSSAPKVDAAPAVDSVQPGEEIEIAESESFAARPDLVSVLKGQFGSASGSKNDQRKTGENKNDDYSKFMEEMNDIL